VIVSGVIINISTNFLRKHLANRLVLIDVCLLILNTRKTFFDLNFYSFSDFLSFIYI